MNNDDFSRDGSGDTSTLLGTKESSQGGFGFCC